jgi:hypothetical protein
MLPAMPDDDSLIVIASYLRTEEAGMLRGLLESAGIAAVIRDDVLSGINPFLQSAIGGVKLAVRAADAVRALEIIGSAGVLPGSGPQEPIEIPEDEWSRAPTPERSRAPTPFEPSRAVWPRVILATLILLALLLAIYGLG